MFEIELPDLSRFEPHFDQMNFAHMDLPGFSSPFDQPLDYGFDIDLPDFAFEPEDY